MPRILCLFLFACAVPLFVQAVPLVIQVHPGGAEGALKTLEEARDAIRAAKAAGTLTEGTEVHVQGGDYVREAPFALGEEDSGTATAPVRYIADAEQIPCAIYVDGIGAIDVPTACNLGYQ